MTAPEGYERHEDLDPEDMLPGDVFVSVTFVKPAYEHRFVVDRPVPEPEPPAEEWDVSMCTCPLGRIVKRPWGHWWTCAAYSPRPPREGS